MNIALIRGKIVGGCCLILFLGAGHVSGAPGGGTNMNAVSIYDFTMTDITGKPVALGDFKGSLVMVVNVASKCGFTRQYAGLQQIYEKYRDRKFVVLGFPANNFKSQEPGTDGEISSFCKLKYGVSFPMFGKISVAGDDIHPLYRYLTTESASNPHGDSIKWNFTKFLVGPDGKIVDRFAPVTTPDSEKVIAAIEANLPK